MDLGNRLVFGWAGGQRFLNHGLNEGAFFADQRHARQAHVLGASACQQVDQLQVLHQLVRDVQVQQGVEHQPCLNQLGLLCWECAF